MKSPKLTRDAGAGLLFMAIGAVGLIGASDLNFGAASRMGPGFLPTVICLLLIFIGLVVGARGMLLPDLSIPSMHLRPILFVIAGLVSFIFLVPVAGLVAAAFALIVISAFARPEARIVPTLAFAAIVSALVSFVFVVVLRQPIPLWW
jgi:hypothetical protein